ncbi:probable sulfatase [Lentisphaera araneosa HTCC2155]|uniref:Probable sulfatase n=1 Tax=Lentisphaera araneosa HTCC2155 TaxID=313628 RepID=A6DIZ3_9BACT|nr:sulfatase [Lentisphaera araneosa]EDM28429.1 probable sulfatase [Lentisphaera araneosa HTCC2155]
MNKLLLTLLFTLFLNQNAFAEDKPNILWLFQEDTSPWMGAYDYEVQKGETPVIDKMASEGVIFKRAYVPAPVCSACRSAVIVGANQFRFGAHEHRSRRGKGALPLPQGMKTLPQLFKEAGYATFNQGKDDYNFTYPPSTYIKVNGKQTSMSWREMPKGKPFFGQIQLKGGKTNTGKFPRERKTNPGAVTVPADYPQNQMYREIVAQHCDTIRSDDDRIGRILDELKKDGLMGKTIVVYFSDHGANNLIRHKQMPTEAGLHVPLVIIGPEKWVPKQAVRNDLVTILDVSATSLTWAGIDYPEWIEGQNLFADDFKARSYVGSGRDRCDHTIDRVRTIRTDKYRYTRNYKLDRVFLQPQYRDNKDYLKFMRSEYAKGTLDPKLAEIYFGERPAEELYDITLDPAQVNNLAKLPKYQAVLKEHRQILNSWVAKGDLGAGQEPDIELEINGNGRFKGVNAEYERVRTDSDGDGLSDLWEQYNNRDPKDGQLMFEFDCGGWQNEGWISDGKTTNISGRQGFLNFDLIAEKASLKRSGLKLDSSRNQGDLVLRIRSNTPAEIQFSANGENIASSKVSGTDEFNDLNFALGANWAGTIKDLKLEFKAPAGTKIEIDWMRVK